MMVRLFFIYPKFCVNGMTLFHFQEEDTDLIPSVTYEILRSDNPFQIPGLLLTLKTVFGRSDDTTLHWHSGTELLYVLDGTVTYTNGGAQQAITAGEFAIINSNVIHQFQNAHADCSNTALTLILPDVWMRQFSTEESPFWFLAETDSARENIICALRQLITSMTSQDPYRNLLLQRDLLALVYTLFSEALTPHPSSKENVSAIYEIIDYINAHYCEPLSLSRISNIFGIQKNYFCRVFHEASGTTFLRYLSRIRLDAALELLASGQATSSQCALACGFSSEKVLIDWCHKIYSCSPKKYLTLSKEKHQASNIPI